MASPWDNKKFAEAIEATHKRPFATIGKFTTEDFPKPLDTAIVFIQKNLRPEEVFEKRALEDWAVNNGWVQPD